MEKQQLIIGVIVGYMLKVMKANKKELKFIKEFACIRHGNYPEFIKLVNGPIPEIVIYDRGELKINPEPQENSFDFVGLLMSAPSMKRFYDKCFKEYEFFIDEDIPDEIYYQLAIYEITIRIHANKFKTLKKSETFESIINNLGEYLDLSIDEIEIIQKGRKLLNMTKHGQKKNYSWREAQSEFEKSFQYMKEKNITLI